VSRVDIKKIEEEEAELAEKRALARKSGKLDTTKFYRLFQKLIDSGVIINPRQERLKKNENLNDR
jgi:hypothetical protein